MKFRRLSLIGVAMIMRKPSPNGLPRAGEKEKGRKIPRRERVVKMARRSCQRHVLGRHHVWQQIIRRSLVLPPRAGSGWTLGLPFLTRPYKRHQRCQYPPGRTARGTAAIRQTAGRRVLVVRWVDRLGRNYDNVVETMREFMRRGVVIKTVINVMTFDGATKDLDASPKPQLIPFAAFGAPALHLVHGPFVTQPPVHLNRRTVLENL
jgi:hypothetical protein